MEILTKFVEFVKLPLKSIWLFALFCAILLFVPSPWLERLHLSAFMESYGSFVGVGLIISALYLLIHGMGLIWKFFKGRKFRARMLADLRDLDPKEKAILREFLIQEQNTIQLPIDQANVAGLIAKGILIRAGDICERSLAGFLVPVKLSKFANENLTLEMLDIPETPTDQHIEMFIRTRPSFLGEIEHHNQLFHSRGLWG